MKVNPVELLPLERLHQNPDNPKKPMGARYRRGLKASLAKFGFAGLLVVAGPDADGTYEVLDGNTRLDELDGQADSVPCVVLDLDAAGRREFALSYDRNRKLFDEDKVVEQLRALAGGGADVKALEALSGVENLRLLIDDQRRAAPAPPPTPARMPEQASLVLYGPAEDVQAVRELLKRLRSRLPSASKARSLVEQAEHYQDLGDESFLLAFLSACARASGG